MFFIIIIIIIIIMFIIIIIIIIIWATTSENVSSDMCAQRRFRPSRKHAYIILTPLNPTFI